MAQSNNETGKKSLVPAFFTQLLFGESDIMSALRMLPEDKQVTLMEVVAEIDANEAVRMV